MNKLQSPIFVIAVLFFCIISNIHAQKSININDNKKIAYLGDESTEIVSHFKDAEKFRRFSYNPELRNLNQSNVNDTILLDFFDGKIYKAIIKNVTSGNDGIVAITAQIANTRFGYCYISISGDGILVSTELPELDEQYDIAKIAGQTYLSQTKMSVAREKMLEGSDPIVPPEIQNADTPNYQSNNIEEAVGIDVMVVYTQKAKDWADIYSSGIDNVISIAMARSNEVMQNSKTGITFNLVHKYQTDYQEVDSNEDLRRFQQKGDGYLDEVHILREQYAADLIIFIPMVTFTGGVAYLLSSESGNKDWCSFSLSRVQQAATGYTVVHEMGHNMGCGHHKAQNYQAGPGLYSYSAGWRGTELGGYTTIMAYESGTYYTDGRTYPRIPYFSSPDISVSGVVIGHTADANNALTLKKTKHVTSSYTQRDYDILLTITNNTKTYGEPDPNLDFSVVGGNLKSGDRIEIDRQPGEDAGIYPIICKVFRGDENVTSEYEFSFINAGIFTIAPRNLTLTLENKAKAYTGNKIYIDPVEIEGLINGDNVEISYNYHHIKNGSYTDHALEIGEYMVTVKVSGNPNYNEASTTESFIVNYDFNDVVKVKWNNTLMLKVAKITKDGFRVTGCQWYKNGKAISGATNYSYSAGPENTDLLDATALYSVEIRTWDGKINTTESLIRLKSFDVKVYPNPKKANETMYLEADIDEDLLDGARIEIYNVAGIPVKIFTVKEHITPLDLPDNKGTYIIKFKGKNGFNKELKAIVK